MAIISLAAGGAILVVAGMLLNAWYLLPKYSELYGMPMDVYMSKLHPLAHKDKIALEELKDYPCLSFDQGEYNSF